MTLERGGIRICDGAAGFCVRGNSYDGFRCAVAGYGIGARPPSGAALGVAGERGLLAGVGGGFGFVDGCLETADDGGFGFFVFLGGHFAFLVELSEVGEGEGGAGGGGVVGGHPLPVDGECSEHGDHGDDEDGGPEDDAAGGAFGGLGEEGGRWGHECMVAGGGWGVEGKRFGRLVRETASELAGGVANWVSFSSEIDCSDRAVASLKGSGGHNRSPHRCAMGHLGTLRGGGLWIGYGGGVCGG